MRIFIVGRKLPAVLVVRKSFSYVWKKYPLFDILKAGSPTAKAIKRRNQVVKLDIESLAHAKWNCKYHMYLQRNIADK